MGPEGAANIIFKDEIAKAEDPKAMRIQKVNEYRQKFANPYVAGRGGVDRRDHRTEGDALLPDRPVRSSSRGRRKLRPGKKHGTIPL